MSVRTEIRDAIIAALNAAPPTDVPEAGKRRWQPGQLLQSVRIAVFFMDEVVEQAGGRNSPIVKRGLIYGVQVVAGVADPADADDALEPALVHVVAVMGDTNLGGAATGVFEQGTRWETGEGTTARFVIGALTRWRVEYQTLRGDITKMQ